ncbi:GNAT family N-acetyltransferase [Rhodobacteraceae bacterium KMM 6894]|nr:GNAT family N-acetyltransferase [Rhodobacteraceae bacterium KMM 6894]
MTETEITIRVHGALDQIGQETWDACACPEAADGRPEDPFTTYRFLKALEDSGSIGPGTGWQAQYMAAEQDGQVIAVAPLYGKSHSQGEYIFDHNWAHAYEGAGGRYYPKLQMAVPFTPVTGRRFLTLPGHEDTGRAALIEGAVRLGEQNGLSSLHVTFCTKDEARAGANLGLMARTSQQFHWVNDGYADFDAFLSALSARKRKTIRKERRVAQGFGGSIVALTGDDLRPEHWDAMWRFYLDTGARKWGTPYLTRAFFTLAAERLANDVLMVLALDESGQPIAGALNFIGRSALYGRYWGCTTDVACLHFELCYYQAIDYAIAHGLSRVEAGAQGEHKLARGYLPVATHSLHWMRDAGFADAVAQYLRAEGAAVAEDIDILTSYGPFRRTKVEDPQ